MKISLIGDSEKIQEEIELAMNIAWKDMFTYIFWKEMVIDKALLFYRIWSAVISMCFLYNCFFMVAREAYFHLHDTYKTVWFIMDYTSDLFYILDMMISCRIGYIENGIFVHDIDKLLRYYTKSTRFTLDVLSILPTDLLYIIVGTKHTMVRLNRLLRLYRMRNFFDILETRTSVPNMIRIIHILVYVLILIHWNGCVYFAISSYIGLGSDSWVYPNDVINFALLPSDHVYLTLQHQYIVPLWWSMLTLTTIGETNSPVTTVSYVYVLVAFMLGVFIFATIFANVGGMINHANIAKDTFHQHLDDVKLYMQARAVDVELQHRVLKWFDYTWEKRQTLDETRALICLPYNLQAEIATHVHYDTLRKVRLFQDCEPGLLHELVLKLQLEVFSPGDFVCRKGDVGREMFIVKSGKLQVVSEDLTKVFKEYGEGDSFGDLSVLTIPGNKHGNKRTASVRSVGFTDLFSLSKGDLLQALETYPEAKNLLIGKASEILRKDGALDDEIANKVARESKDAKIDLLVRDVHKLNIKLNRVLREMVTKLDLKEHKSEEA